jgi:hypothetical protein
MKNQSVTCKRCNQSDYREEQRGPHLTAICNICNKYIKHLPQGGEPTLYFGKYQGKKVSEIMDADYLQYCWDKMKLPFRLMEAIEKQLDYIHSIH